MNSELKITAIQISFEALGMQHVAFAELPPLGEPIQHELFEAEVQKIAPSAIVTNVCTTLVDMEAFVQKNLSNLIYWNESVADQEIHK